MVEKIKQCSCGETKGVLDVSFTIHNHKDCWFSMSGVLCKKCFSEQKVDNSWKPKLSIGIEFTKCRLCGKEKEKCICEKIIKEYIQKNG